ncbi:hypothetical protein PIB30_099665 [Stylosanthes scabra]|uniref:Uncharacterized protein n=1 Tax=Stylosanthes scabra TaxID=79078 RepID=A0ABU6YUL3_9FABA|nr:hypothetical protein [Stylosanthes scabra]
MVYLTQQFWNVRGVLESQRLLDVSSLFTGRSSIWFRLWSLRNPNADWDTFDLAFLHQFQPDMRPILPKICWKEVEDWEIEWVELRAKLLLQSYPETTKPQSKQGIAAGEIQEEKEIWKQIWRRLMLLQRRKDEILRTKAALAGSRATTRTTTTAGSIAVMRSLSSSRGEKRPPSRSNARRKEGRTEAVPGGHNGIADGFVAEGKRRTLVALVDGDTTVTDGGLRAQLLCRSVLLSPPPLLGAIGWAIG